MTGLDWTILDRVYSSVYTGAAPGEDSDREALLGRASAQKALTHDSAPTGLPVIGTAGWFSTNFDPNRGFVAIARIDGPYADWVGEHVEFSVESRSIVVYLRDLAYPEEDVALSRRAYLALSPLAVPEIRVEGRVLG